MIYPLYVIIYWKFQFQIIRKLYVRTVFIVRSVCMFSRFTQEHHFIDIIIHDLRIDRFRSRTCTRRTYEFDRYLTQIHSKCANSHDKTIDENYLPYAKKKYKQKICLLCYMTPTTTATTTITTTTSTSTSAYGLFDMIRPCFGYMSWKKWKRL